MMARGARGAGRDMKILLIEDHVIFRRGLKEFLTEALGAVEFGEDGTAQEGLDSVWREKWDLVILDITLPGRNGLEFLKQLKQERAQLPVLVVSAHPEEEYTFRSLRAGAAGYVAKTKAATELEAAVKKVLAGGVYVSSPMAEKLAQRVRMGSSVAAHERLSDREFEILRLLAAGKRGKAIAADLSLTVQTVSTHRANILKKLGLNSIADLVRYAVEHGLVD